VAMGWGCGGAHPPPPLLVIFRFSPEKIDVFIAKKRSSIEKKNSSALRPL